MYVRDPQRRTLFGSTSTEIVDFFFFLPFFQPLLVYKCNQTSAHSVLTQCIQIFNDFPVARRYIDIQARTVYVNLLMSVQPSEATVHLFFNPVRETAVWKFHVSLQFVATEVTLHSTVMEHRTPK